MANKKSSAPSGLQLSRQGNKFTLKWSIPSCKYGDGQHLEYKFKTNKSNKYVSHSIGKTTTSHSESIDKDDYYPNKKNNKYKPKLQSVWMRVQGNRNAKKDKYDWSVWKDKKFDIDPPSKPTLGFTLDSVTYYKGSFDWNVAVSDTSQKIFTRVLWESILIEDCNTSDSKNVAGLFKSSTLGWQTGTSTSASSAKAIEEDSALFDKPSYSYTRWFRIKAQGPNGDSDWRYEKHVYSTPKQATDISVTCEESGPQYIVNVGWKSDASKARPIDRTEVQYTMQIPTDVDLSCPVSGFDWDVGCVVNDSSDRDGGSFTTDSLLALDQCLYVRVKNFREHAELSSTIVRALVGNLKNPTNLSVTPTPSTHTITISATNTSEVSVSKLAVIYETAKQSKVIGVLEDANSHVIYCPDWSSENNVTIRVQAFVGTATYVTDGNIRYYTILTKMASEGSLSYDISGGVPKPPTGVSLDRTDTEGTIKVDWDWGQAAPEGVELSWANHEDAWQSTDPPETYDVSASNPSSWYISGLEMGERWYVKLRFYKGTTNDRIYSDYTIAYFIDLMSTPDTPALQLSPAIVRQDGEIKASWVYVSTDNTPQSYAELALVVNGVVQEPAFAHTLTAQHITFKPSDFNGQSGDAYTIALRVKSGSGKFSEWATQSVIIAEPLSCAIALDTSSGSCWQMKDIIDDEDQPLVTRTQLSLVDMPMVIGVTGSNTGVDTTVIIERDSNFNLDRPDGKVIPGTKGETICIKSGLSPIEISAEDLVGSLDDDAAYNILATVKDGLGQVAEAVPVRFEVHWDHQVGFPTATVEIDNDLMIAKIKPKGFAGALESDYCDIYRLSVDKPELIYHEAAFGTTYVDPYPTLGPMGGYRIVACTANGDYKSNGTIAWYDTPEYDWPIVENPDDLSVIDFADGQIRFYFNNDLSGGWTKNFTKVQFLDGKTVGYWNPGATRDKSLKTLVITTLDQEMIKLIHQLATYDGPCHVRTADGDSFTANVEVPTEENLHEDLGMKLSYSLNMEQVDSEGFDAMTLAEWNARQ